MLYPLPTGILLSQIFISFLLLQTCLVSSHGDNSQQPWRRDITSSSQTSLSSHQDKLSHIISSSPLLSFHRSLCETESISGNESHIGDYLVGYLRSRGFGALRQEVEPEGRYAGKRFNVFAWPRDTSGGNEDTDYESVGKDQVDNELGEFLPKVILSSHIDTVPPYIPYSLSYSSPSLSPETNSENDGPKGTVFNGSQILISGRGTVDAKACVAAQTHAVISLLAESKARTETEALPVALLFVVSEETLGTGMKTFSASPLHRHLSNPSPHSTSNNGYSTLIFGEPTQSHLASGHKGLFAFRLTALGRAAHSGYPWLGLNANNLLVDAVSKIARLGDISEVEGGLARSEKYGNSTVNVGVIRGGVAMNVVSERAEAEVAVRLAGGEVGSAREVIRRAVRGVAEGMGKGIEFWEGEAHTERRILGSDGSDETGLFLEFFGPAYEPVDLDTDIIDDGDGNGDGKDLFGKPITVNYGTDVPNLTLQKKGVRRYLYGPGSILVAHGPREALTVEDLEGSVRGYRKLILDALRR